MPDALANTVCSVGQHGHAEGLADIASKQAIELQNLKGRDEPT